MARRRKYFSAARAARELLGWTDRHGGERLVKLLLAKEQEAGKRIMLRAGSEASPRYRLTEPMVRRHCAELFLSTPDDLATEVKAYMLALDGRVRAMVDERVAPEHEELRTAVRKANRELAVLKEAVTGTTRMLGRLARAEERLARLEADCGPVS